MAGRVTDPLERFRLDYAPLFLRHLSRRDESGLQAAYDLGLRLAFCQPNIAGVLLFHSHDETALLSWQSGVYYADGTVSAGPPPKALPQYPVRVNNGQVEIQTSPIPIA